MTGVDVASRIHDADRNSKIRKDILSKPYQKFDSLASQESRDLDGWRHHLYRDHHRVGRDFPRTTKDGVAAGPYLDSYMESNTVEGSHGLYGLNQNLMTSSQQIHGVAQNLPHKSFNEQHLQQFGFAPSLCKEKEDPFDGLYGRHGGLIMKFKYSLPVFDGFWQVEDLMSWIAAIEDLFEEINPPEHVKCKIVWSKMEGAAYYWWKVLQNERFSKGKDPISSWSRMRKLLIARFAPTKCSTKCPNDISSPVEGSIQVQSEELVGADSNSKCGNKYGSLTEVCVIEHSKEVAEKQSTKCSEKAPCESITNGQACVSDSKCVYAVGADAFKHIDKLQHWDSSFMVSICNKPYLLNLLNNFEANGVAAYHNIGVEYEGENITKDVNVGPHVRDTSTVLMVGRNNIQAVMHCFDPGGIWDWNWKDGHRQLTSPGCPAINPGLVHEYIKQCSSKVPRMGYDSCDFIGEMMMANFDPGGATSHSILRERWQSHFANENGFLEKYFADHVSGCTSMTSEALKLIGSILNELFHVADGYDWETYGFYSMARRLNLKMLGECFRYGNGSTSFLFDPGGNGQCKVSMSDGQAQVLLQISKWMILTRENSTVIVLIVIIYQNLVDEAHIVFVYILFVYLEASVTGVLSISLTMAKITVVNIHVLKSLRQIGPGGASWRKELLHMCAKKCRIRVASSPTSGLTTLQRYVTLKLSQKWVVTPQPTLTRTNGVDILDDSSLCTGDLDVKPVDEAQLCDLCNWGVSMVWVWNCQIKGKSRDSRQKARMPAFVIKLAVMYGIECGALSSSHKLTVVSLLCIYDACHLGLRLLRCLPVTCLWHLLTGCLSTCQREGRFTGVLIVQLWHDALLLHCNHRTVVGFNLARGRAIPLKGWNDEINANIQGRFVMAKRISIKHFMCMNFYLGANVQNGTGSRSALDGGPEIQDADTCYILEQVEIHYDIPELISIWDKRSTLQFSVYHFAGVCGENCNTQVMCIMIKQSATFSLYLHCLSSMCRNEQPMVCEKLFSKTVNGLDPPTHMKGEFKAAVCQAITESPKLFFGVVNGLDPPMDPDDACDSYAVAYPISKTSVIQVRTRGRVCFRGRWR